jgi:hypothetical protein
MNISLKQLNPAQTTTTTISLISILILPSNLQLEFSTSTTVTREFQTKFLYSSHIRHAYILNTESQRNIFQISGIWLLWLKNINLILNHYRTIAEN